MDSSKVCSKCKLNQPLFLFASQPKGKGDKQFNLSYYCKFCQSSASKAHRKNNAEKYTEASRKWVKNNPIKHLENGRKFRKENPEKGRTYSKKWYESNSEHSLNYGQAWRESNVEKCKGYAKSWNENNPQKAIAKNHNRRTRMNQAAGKLTKETIELMYLVHGRACLKCSSLEKPTIDHILPIINGGSHYIYNLQPLCGPCNSSKSARHSADYRRWSNV